MKGVLGVMRDSVSASIGILGGKQWMRPLGDKVRMALE